ncbi:AEC family transporter [Halioglobus maricola]|uniref:AEC family transporter n=1 Tax=Halioglobus maricola TaxID=2601894 RepID=A0A5P9NME2_9GAMM|nr:AEC family transporter [Halioglobus maricola]QFU76434.1 AEC family transporter [Halioglobus maricola]
MNLQDASQLLSACLAVSLPTFAWVAAGVLLNRIGLFPQALNDWISRWSFNLGLPLMLFAGAASIDFNDINSVTYLLAGVLSTALVVVGAWIYSARRGHPFAERGIFVQGAYRSNLAIVGVALCVAAYGEEGARLAALAIAAMTSFYNVLAVIVLNATLGGNASLWGAVSGVLRNPLIIGIIAGALLSIAPIPVPPLVTASAPMLSAFFLPLVLLCIGAAMRLGELRSSGPLAWEACVWRLVVAPLLTVLLALAMGVRGEALGVLFLLVGTPAAASGYIMVAAARGNAVLAANIVVLTTVLSGITLTAGLFLLSLLGLVGSFSG